MTRKFLKLGIFIILVGIILSVAGIVILGEGDIRNLTRFYNEDHLYEEKNYKVEQDNIKSLNLNITNRHIEIKRTNVSNIEIKYFEKSTEQIDITETDNILYITNKHNNRYFKFFRWSSKNRIVIEIKVPLDFELDTFTSETINGGLTMSDIKINNIDYITTNGNVNFNNVVVSGNLKSGSTNGNVILESVHANNIHLTSTNGSIKLTNVASNIILGETTNGKINFDLIGNPDDYSITAKTTNGKITFNGLRLANGTHQAEKSNKIDVKTTNGSITINIK